MGTPHCFDSSPTPTARIGLCTVTAAFVQPACESCFLWPRFFSGCDGQLASPAYNRPTSLTTQLLPAAHSTSFLISEYTNIIKRTFSSWISRPQWRLMSPKNTNEQILVVDDDQAIRWMLREALQSWGFAPIEASTAAEAVKQFQAELPAAVLLDIDLPDGSGLDVLREIKHEHPEAIAIMITGNVQLDNTISALRGGAYDFIAKPINLEELRVTLRNAIEARELRRTVAQVRKERAREFNFKQIVGESPAMKKMLTLAAKVAESEVSSVLLQGESGTGKDLVAKAIHYGSQRAEGPFVAVNCAALPATLIESELFGYEKGAFTDAKARKEGLFEQAEGGTLFLDEIGELELNLQAKLLRVLEEGALRRVGGLKDIPLDARVIAASNRDLKAESEAGRFRLDLYYRLSVIQIDIPPLRERGDDILLLAGFYIKRFNEQLRKR